MKTMLTKLAGKTVAAVTGDPVLKDFLEVVGTHMPASSLLTILTWRLAMDSGAVIAQSAFLRRWIYRHVRVFHKLNQKFDATASAVAFSSLQDEQDRLRWCRIFGIDPQRDLCAPLSTFKTVNDLFTHAPGPGTRPIASAEDPGIVIAPCDGSYAMFPTTEYLRSFVSKQSHFEIASVLGMEAGQYTEHFAGGAASFIWLSAVDNHRWFAPIAGRVIHAERIQACTHGRMGLFMEEGYCEANARGVIIIEGICGARVAFIPIGLTPINSIRVTVHAGDSVAKGDPLGMFEVGGSAGILLFDRRLQVDFGADHARFEKADELLNLNYVGTHNKARLLIGQALAGIAVEKSKENSQNHSSASAHDKGMERA